MFPSLFDMSTWQYQLYHLLQERYSLRDQFGEIER
jgi:hypothetical protein